MGSEFNNWYEKWTGSKVKCENTDIIGAWQHQQSKIDKLQANFDQHDQWLGQRNRDVQELNDIIAKHAAEKNELQKQRDSFIKAYEIEMDKSVELQKRVDAAKQLIEDLNKCYQQDHQNKFEYWRGFADSAGILGKRLEQALKGGSDESN